MIPHYFAPLTIVLLAGMVFTRIFILRRSGTRAMHFGKTDKTDFLLLPFVLFYFYILLARAFGWPAVSSHVFFESAAISWIGVFICFAGVIFFLLSLISFGKSFRVGIDVRQPDRLVTTGIFGISRNPMYVSFAAVLLGQFFIFPNWILLVYVLAGFWLFNRQIVREEVFLNAHYGKEYRDYCQKVPRYL